MKDGVRIAVRMWLPEGTDQQPVPAVIEYIPYGRMAEETTAAAPMLAPHGIAFVRPDIRGSGDSEGVLRGEYTQQQIDDGASRSSSGLPDNPGATAMWAYVVFPGEVLQLCRLRRCALHR